MDVYTERLRVPLSWWLTGLVLIAIAGAELFPGFGWPVAVIGYAMLGGGYAATLAWWGESTVEVADGELRAGTARLPLAAVGEVAELDQGQMRAICGPRADPAAFLLIRPYLKQGVYVQVTGDGQAGPYWVLGSRRPAALAAAISGARPAAGQVPAPG
jgi:hypothetical protein